MHHLLRNYGFPEGTASILTENRFSASCACAALESEVVYARTLMPEPSKKAKPSTKATPAKHSKRSEPMDGPEKTSAERFPGGSWQKAAATAQHRGRRVDFNPFAASFFAPHLFWGSIRSGLGCGASALALITGIAPEIIASENGGAHYSDRFMTRFLRARMFRTLRLTPALVSQAKSSIGSYHVLLVSQLLRSGEGTWGVVFADFYYHYFDAYALSALSFLNKPILSAYLVFHQEWRINYAVKKDWDAVVWVLQSRA
jgi:hypothetical protein